MKSLKKEVITIVALLVVAVIGTYVVNASIGDNAIENQVIEKNAVSDQTAIEDRVQKESAMKLAAGEDPYGCDSCDWLLWKSTQCDDEDKECIDTWMDAYQQCLSDYGCSG